MHQPVLAGVDERIAPYVLLAVEVVSAGSVTTDRVTKPAEYAQAGIPHFWRVDALRGPLLEAFDLQAGAYRSVGTWSQGAAFSANGRMLFVGNMVEKDISVFRVAEDGKLAEAGPRIRVAGGARNPFTEDAVRAMHDVSGGIPRLLNTLATTALLDAFGDDAATIDAERIAAAAREHRLREAAPKDERIGHAHG